MKEQVQDTNSLLQVRRDKLAALQERGNDPFLITRYDQTHHTDEVKALYEDRESIPNMRITWGHNLPMRHFHAFLEPYPNE